MRSKRIFLFSRDRAGAIPFLGLCLALLLMVGTGSEGHSVWVNPRPTPLDHWHYLRLDNTRERFSEDVAFLGLAFGDINRDGFSDIVSGRYFYSNPGGNLSGEWRRVTFPQNLDAMLVIDVDSDGQLDVIAQALPGMFWLKPNAQGDHWRVREVARLEPTPHTNSQGYVAAQIVPGGPPELAFTTGKGLWYLRIPDNASSPWPKVQITADDTSDDLLAAGDLDGDGDAEVVGVLGDSGPNDGRGLFWWENPGGGSGNWKRYSLGTTTNPADRSAVADINEDGRLDLIVSEENGRAEGASTFWFENPPDPRNPWKRRAVTTQGSTNSMSAADMDGDGDPDIITAEHKGALRVTVWENQEKGNRWVAHLVGQGQESHLGARVADLDGDGDLEIVSIGWDDYRQLHLWRNDGK
jgi:hypothetical protein